MSLDALTGVVVDPLTDAEFDDLDRLETAIEVGSAAAFQVGAALAEISSRRLYRARFSSFDAYCEAQWQMDRSRAYQLIAAAEIFAELSTVVDSAPDSEVGRTPLPVNEAQARVLVKFRGRPEVAAAVMREASKDGPATAKKLKAAAKTVVPPVGPKPKPAPVAPPSDADIRTKRAAERAHGLAEQLSQCTVMEARTIRLLETVIERWRKP